MKIAILYIGIGHYVKFWEDFYSSCEKNFLVNSKKDYFVFTDQINKVNGNSVTVFAETNYGWPGNTLYRFRMFNRIGEKLKQYDWVFFFNANAMFLKKVSEDILPKDDCNIITVGHFKYFGKDIINHNGYERHKKSTAYVAWGKEGHDFVQCCLIGATGTEFYKLSHEIAENIKIDDENHVCAIWHDESHFNKYIVDKKYKVLGLNYAKPEIYANGNFEDVYILMRDKTRLGNLAVVRSSKKPSFFKWLLIKTKNQIVKISNNYHYFIYRKLKWKK